MSCIDRIDTLTSCIFEARRFIAMYDQVMSPFVMKGLTLRNRIVRGPHNVGLPWVDESDDLLEYHRTRAANGVALTILGVGGVDPLSPSSIPAHDDRVIDGYRRFAETLHAEGSAVMQQLWHSGPARALPGVQPWSASEAANPRVGVAARSMPQSMIDHVVAAFAAAAVRAESGGLDGVEIHAAHGYLIAEFLSPATNHREDRYGGSAVNRARLLSEVLTAVRAAVTPSFVVGVRLGVDDDLPGGLRVDDTAELAQQIESMVDFIDLSTGSYHRYHRIFATTEAPLGYEVVDASIVTRALSVPTIVTGRIMTLDLADHVVSSGAADLVSMVRPLIADPELVTKTLHRDSGMPRPCIGTNEGCVGAFLTTGRMSCSVNPHAARELRLAVTHVAPTRRRIIVVGAGPAGLEVARASALRGHEVQLHELTNHLGGQLAIAAAAPHRSDLGTLVQWYRDELERLGVQVVLRSPAEPDMLRALAPDALVLATGSRPPADGRQTRSPGEPVSDQVATSWQVLGFGGSVQGGSTALVYDDEGGNEALAVVEKLLDDHYTVTLATRFDAIGASVPAREVTVHQILERLVAAGVELVTLCHVIGVSDGHAELSVLYGARTVRVAADVVVMVGPNVPNRENADLLDGVSFPVHLVGDVTGSRTVRAAISQASALAEAL